MNESTGNEVSNEVLDNFMNALYSVPGVKVNRENFLNETLSKYTSSYDLIPKAIDTNPLEAGFNNSTIDLIAKKIRKESVITSSRKSFISGIPGGIAMAATIPYDTAQFYSQALILAQKLAYLYGYEDLWDGEYSYEEAKNQMMLFLGVMFGVSGSTATLKVVTANLSNQALKKLPQKALTKTIYYPIIKKICKYLGINLTKKSFAKGVSKVIPFVGGVVSGGLTFASLSNMGEKLQNTLSQANSKEYTADIYNRDLKEVQNDLTDFTDVQFDEITVEVENGSSETPNSVLSLVDQLEKLTMLKDSNAISEDEYIVLKSKLLKEIK
ncbi:SHOCT domain-containing protein [Fusibacter sp. JL216-2]|uniref:SHOCT domain-containing protein n=1 Tax=Fusibacter sp. JL216-2 TaxID=3071453 RepID=UPI003D34E35A